jgi:hypothetical protein
MSIALKGKDSDLPVADPTRNYCHPYHSVGSKPVSAQSLLKTGISAVLARDFRQILARVAILRRL